MASPPVQALQEVRKRLAQPLPNKDALLKLLKEAEIGLSELEVQPSSRNIVKQVKDLIVQTHLIHHNDKEVRLLVSVCISEIIRILVPDPPFSDEIFKDIFKLIVGTFLDLADTVSPYYSRRLKILENVACVKCSIILLDIGCEDLALEMFKVFFSVVKDGNRGSVFPPMVAIMSHILEENASQYFLDIILRNLLKDEKSASFWLAISLIQSCYEKLEPPLTLFLTSCILDKEASRSVLNQSYHGIILRLFQYTPTILTSVVPRLTEELLTDEVDVRREAVSLVGKLLALSRLSFCTEYRSVFIEFLKRFSDKSMEVRISAVESLKACPIPSTHISEAHDILGALVGRLLDTDDKVRIRAVISVCELAKCNLAYFPPEMLLKVVERLRDKMVSVRKTTMRELLEFYGFYCYKCSNKLISFNDQYEQIPSCILLLCFEKCCKDFRPQNMELLLAENLFPDFVSVKDRVQHWVVLFSFFKTPQINALRAILSQKKRFQKEMLEYLGLRDIEKENGSENVHPKILECFRKLSCYFIDSFKAEDCFQKLHQMKDNNIFKALLELIEEPTTAIAAHSPRVEFLKKIDKKHRNLDFFKALSIKCSHSIFTPEYIGFILESLLSGSIDESKNLQSSMDLLLVILDSFPVLLKGSEKCLKKLCLDKSFKGNYKLLQILAKAGPCVAIKLSDIYPFLESMCIEGTRLESKLAVSVIISLTNSPDSCIFFDLCKKLTNSLKDGNYIPSILQSLGCISRYSPSSFKLYDVEVKKFIHDIMFDSTYVYLLDEQMLHHEDSDFSSSCRLMVYGLKFLVKSFLPAKIENNRQGLKEILNLLLNILQNEGNMINSLSSDIDKAHLRLVAATSILKLATRWDSHISPSVFRLVIMMAKDSSDVVRKLFLFKVHGLLMKHEIPTRYACAFALASEDNLGSIQADSMKYLTEFLKERDGKDQLTKNSAIEDVNVANITTCPEYIVVFIIHVLAYDPGFPPDNDRCAQAYAVFCRPLINVLQALINPESDDISQRIDNNTLSNVLSIFRAIKKSEDPLDCQATPKLHTLSNIGIFITKALLQHFSTLSVSPRVVLLPSSLFKVFQPTKNCEANFITFIDDDFAKRMLDFMNFPIFLTSSSNPRKTRKVDEKTVASDSAEDNLNVFLHNGHIDINLVGGSNVASKPGHAKLLPEKDGKEQILSSNSMSNQRKEQLSYDFAITAPSFSKCTYSEVPEKNVALTENSDFWASQSGHCSVELSIEPVESSKESELPGESLAGRCIRLWSLVDNCYIRGTVTSHDSRSGTCKVIYDNGDVELLSLKDEKWEIVDDELSADKFALDLRKKDRTPCDALGEDNSNMRTPLSPGKIVVGNTRGKRKAAPSAAGGNKKWESGSTGESVVLTRASRRTR